MKSLKNRVIPAIALSIGIYGCSNQTQTFEELRWAAQQPGEQAVIKDVKLEYCDDLKITFGVDSYFINCDNSHNFYFHPIDGYHPPTSLTWGQVSYFDDDNDDKVNSIYIVNLEGACNFIGLDENVETNTNRVYKTLLSIIKKKKVHELWESRWRR